MYKHAAVVIAIFSASAIGQTAFTSTSQAHTKYSAFWSTAPGYESHIVLNNTSRKETITVTPTLLRHSGDTISLDSIKMPPLASHQVDLNIVLAQAGITPSTGSATFAYDGTYENVINIETTVVTEWAKSAFTIPTVERHLSDRMETAFYVPTKSSRLVLAIQNAGSSTATIIPTVYLTGAAVSIAPVSINAGASSVMALGDLDGSDLILRSLWQAGASGGISVACAESAACKVNASAWIVDRTEQFGSMLSFSSPWIFKGRSLFGTQLLPSTGIQSVLGTSDFRSQIVLRNISASGNTAVVTVYDESGKPSSAELYFFAWETKLVKLDTLTSAPLSSASSVTITYSGPEGSLLGRSFSEAPGKAIVYTSLEHAPYSIYNGVHWQVDAVANTYLTVSNTSAIEDNITLTLSTPNGPLTIAPLALGPHQTKTLDLRQELPSGLIGHGGYRISGKDSDSRLLVKQQMIYTTSKIIAPLYGGPPYVTDFFMDQNYHVLSTGTSTVFYCKLGWSDSSETSHNCGTVSHDRPSDFSITGAGNSRTIAAQSNPGRVTFIEAHSHYTDPIAGLVPVMAQAEAAIRVKCTMTSLETTKDDLITPASTMCFDSAVECTLYPRALVAIVQFSCTQYDSGRMSPDVRVEFGNAGGSPVGNAVTFNPTSTLENPPSTGNYVTSQSNIGQGTATVVGSITIKADLTFPGTPPLAEAAGVVHREKALTVTATN